MLFQDRKHLRRFRRRINATMFRQVHCFADQLARVPASSPGRMDYHPTELDRIGCGLGLCFGFDEFADVMGWKWRLDGCRSDELMVPYSITKATALFTRPGRIARFTSPAAATNATKAALSADVIWEGVPETMIILGTKVE